MKKIDKGESEIAKDLKKTQRHIFLMKAKAKANALLGMFFGGIGRFLVFSLGALILIGLTRYALNKWSEAYMPKNDGGTGMTILGVPIPGWGTLKSIGLGIYNFVTVGLRNFMDRLSGFFKGIKKKLFGKKGAIRDGIETRNTMRKLFGAWLIGVAKKSVGGVIAKIISWALSLIPGVGPIISFICKLIPAIITFITTQVMLHWSNKKADAERAMQNNVKDMMADSRGQINAYMVALKKAGRGVKTFKNQMGSIPGLQTGNGQSKSTLQGGIPRGAIMRSVDMRYSKSFSKAQEIHENAVDEDKTREETKNRLKERGTNDLLARLNANMTSIGQELDQHMEEWKTNQPLLYNPFAMARERGRKLKELKARKIADTIKPQMDALDIYITELSKSQRFKNVQGMLYDPVSGWNPGYRVMASDLRTIIPLNPFEAIHKTPDIYFGSPAEAETSSTGFLPFTWYQNKAKISVHPILYELARAKAIREIYENVCKDIGKPSFWDPIKSKELDIADYAVQWNQWNSAIADHDVGGYDVERDVIFKNRFTDFYTRIQKG